MNATIYLPKFPWFYESILSSIVDSQEEYMIENLIEDWKIDKNSLDTYSDMSDIIDIDYKKTHDGVAKQWTSLFIDILPDLEKDTWLKIVAYESLWSPKYYNFSTDEVNANIEYDIEKIVQYLEKNRDDFTKYIKENNTSYDGFIAYLDNTFDDYIKALRDDTKESELTQVIDFYIEQNKLEENIDNIHYDIEVCLEYTNKPIL